MFKSRIIEKATQSLPAIDTLLVFVFLFILVRFYRAPWHFPPGPRGFWVVGNALHIPRDKQWLQFDQWIKQYGDIVGINVMGEPTMVLGSFHTASDLLDGRGTIYSDRPQAIMAGELVGWNRGLGYSPGPHSARFREFRRLFHQLMGPRPSQEPSMLLMQERESRKLARRILREPEGFIRHARESTGSLILRVAYGYQVAEDQREDPLVRIAEEAMQGFARASEPGAFVVDSFPFLKWLPEWAPGAGFKAVARRMRGELERLYDIPFDFVKREMAMGVEFPSFTSSYLREKESLSSGDEELIKAAAASLYSGGADTTPSSLASFILAMTLHPDIQARAQGELDTVVGTDFSRLPRFSDKDDLPFVNAIMLEVLRWHPAVPLGLAHRLNQDDEYRGFLIPKGTIVWANIWTMLHDESIFPEPSSFAPGRFLGPDGKLRKLERWEDPSIIGFGFGRRICPGMFLALNSIFIGIATLLYVFDISKARDESGHEITPVPDFRGFISHPVPFKCTISPRSKAAELLVHRETD